MATTGFDLQELDAAFGEYHRTYSYTIGQKLLRGNVTSRYMNVVDKVIDEYGEAGADMSEILQAFQSNAKAVAKGDLVYTPNKIVTTTQMVAYKFVEEELKKSWAAQIRAGEIPPSTKLEAFLMDRLITKAVDEHERLQIGKGVYVAPTIGTAGASAGAMNGYLKVLTDKIAASGSKINIVNTGTFTDNTIADYVRVMCEHNDLGNYDASPLNVYMSVKNAKRFRRDNNVDNAGQGVQIVVQNGQQTVLPNAQMPNGAIEVPYENFTIVGLPSMSGSNRIFITPKENFKKVCDYDGVRFRPMQRDGFATYIFGTMGAGVGFTYDELVWCNDQA